ncbi:MAG TPA: glycosyltransferase family 2 protein [Prolixibacteraceae bacterium]|nr:glycosyltransferase family 2 protein [Prolixibacteraceae bacterium]
MIDISVVIVNYRGWKHLEKCLKAFESFENDQFSYEIIIVDNCSDDGQLIHFQKRFPKCFFILNTGNNGFANGCNMGAAASKGVYLLFLNSDILATESAIYGLLQTLRSKTEIMILSCKQLNSKGREEQAYRLFPSFLTMNGIMRAIYRKVKLKKTSHTLSSEEEIIYPDWVSGSVILMSKHDFENIGGWDERYWLYYEDVDLCWRAVSYGGKVGLHNQISIIHNHGGATRINIQTATLTKAEVIISLHVFLSSHYSTVQAIGLHLLVIVDVLLVKLIPALLGIPFFFIKRLNLYSQLYQRLVVYYLHALVKRTWVSPRSVKYKESL